MEIVTSFIQPLISCIGTPVLRQFGYLKAKENVDKLIRLADDIEANKKDIQDQIDAASRDGKRPTHKVTRWIEKVEGLGGEVRTVQTDYEQSGQCWPNCWSSYKIGRRASKLLVKMIDLDKEQSGFDVVTTNMPPASVQQMSSTSNLVGNVINLNKVKICGYLREETEEVIGIWGMGGVGKTTLLEAINDNFLNNNNDNSVANNLFDHVIFVVVSKEHKLENLQKNIVNKLGLPSSADLVSQAEIISQFLKKKNFLLLLDDIWEIVQLKDLGIPYHCSSISNSGRRFRRKVVFTTRSMKVCKGMNYQGRIIEVECLKKDEAWNLFKNNVGEDIIDQIPRSLAEEVARECDGLPLAVIVIGRAMATKKSQHEWDYALTQLRKSQHSNIPGMEDDDFMFSKLKLSYDYLRNDKMRECFLCCSLWPEDFEIEIKDLIECWMGLGLIDNFEDINEAYGEGHSLIGILITVSLLEPVHETDDVIRVHDVIRDLALWIARGSETNRNRRWLVKAGVGLKEVPKEMFAKWEPELVSLMENEISELPPNLPPCPNLSTLLLQKNRLTSIPGGFFTHMKNLKYLDLSCNYVVREIPKEICCLIQLRYLNLSNTSISSLPEELGELKNLKYLLIRDVEFLGEVRGIIRRLLKLEYLDVYPCGWVETDELLGLPSLKALGTEIGSEHALQQLSLAHPIILHLNISIDSTTSIHFHRLLSSCTKQSLRELMFTDCHRIREVVGDSECFQRLRRLSIYNCNGLKDITWVLHLPCLERLLLHGCDEMEQLVVIGGGDQVTKPTFPRLRELELRDLPKLAMICDNPAAVNFPYLEMIDVTECKKLKELPFHPQLPNNNNCSRLKRIIGSGSWWEGIQWEDRSSLQPYFMPYDLD